CARREASGPHSRGDRDDHEDPPQEPDVRRSCRPLLKRSVSGSQTTPDLPSGMDHGLGPDRRVEPGMALIRDSRDGAEPKGEGHARTRENVTHHVVRSGGGLDGRSPDGADHEGPRIARARSLGVTLAMTFTPRGRRNALLSPFRSETTPPPLGRVAAL